MVDNMLLKRVISSFFFILLIILTLFVLPNWFFALVVIIITAVALYEFFTLIQKKGILIYKYFGVALGIIIPLTVYNQFELTKGWELAFIVAACLILFLLQFIRRDSSQAIVGVSTTLFGVLYISWFFSFVIKLKLINDGVIPDGAKILAFLLLVTKMGDIGAYFIGSRFGKHHLIPRISPKKSVEGAIGGFACSIITSLLCRSFMPGIEVHHFIILGFLLGFLAQVGDLSESLIKRDCQVKDASNLLPGLGGMLDVVDSILFTAPILYFYIKLFI
jgi:phosphatidate cytidylyltransferase